MATENGGGTPGATGEHLLGGECSDWDGACDCASALGPFEDADPGGMWLPPRGDVLDATEKSASWWSSQANELSPPPVGFWSVMAS